MKCIDLIAGARPNFMKIAPIIDALKAAEARGGALRYRLIHTGQHYDKAMSGAGSSSVKSDWWLVESPYRQRRLLFREQARSYRRGGLVL